MLYRFQIELSDVDRGIYESLDFRVSQHPSEIPAYLLSRALAYALSYQEHIEFSSAGLSDPEVPALMAKSGSGNLELWIEIGNPSYKKLHKASKVAKQVVVYTYKKPEDLVKEIKANTVHRADEILIYALDPKFLQKLEEHLTKNNRWSILVQQGQLDVNFNDLNVTTEVQRITL